MSRRLILIRHAKTQPYAATDHQRSLTDSGQRAACDIGVQLRARGLNPDYAVVSSATRTRQTWAAIASELDTPPHVEFSDVLYHAAPEDVIEALRWVPVGTATAIYVGHNPTAGELAYLLDDGSGDGRALAEIAMGYPTGAVSVFEVGPLWSELRLGSARLTDFFVGLR